MSNEFWFARRYPVGNPSNAVAPVTSEGRMVGFAFMAAMLLGAAIGGAVGIGGNLVLGVATFAVIGGAAGFAFIAIAGKKTDRNHTVDDYRAGIPAQKAAAAQRKGLAVLEIRNLHVRVADEGREILKGLDLSIAAGEVHAIMGPNGSGKSTLAHVLAGKDGYEITDGSVTFAGSDLLALEPEERAVLGVFLAFQYPVEIPGVSGMTFLKAAVNAQRKGRGETELTTPDFMRRVKDASDKLHMTQDMLRRPINTGFSGGEKKRNEILQMALLQPRLAILDETDSGLDIDALRIVSGGVNALRSPDRSMLLITHYQRLLDYIVPDFVHVMSNGRIVRSGGKELALELEQRGYADYGADALV